MTSRSTLIKKWFEEQSNGKLVFAALILGAVIYVAFGFGYDKDYLKKVEVEIKLAQHICQNSLEWVLANPKRLKMGHSDLKNIKVRGQKVELEHVKYPKVIFLDSGIRKINARGSTANDLYCVVTDPRSSGRHYYFNYDERRWVDKVRFHR